MFDNLLFCGQKLVDVAAFRMSNGFEKGSYGLNLDWKDMTFLNYVWMHGRVMNRSLCLEGKGGRKEGKYLSLCSLIIVIS